MGDWNGPLQPGDAWATNVGSQGVDEFLELSAEAGLATPEDAVEAYLDEIPRIFGEPWSCDEERDWVRRSLLRHIEDNRAETSDAR